MTVPLLDLGISKTDQEPVRLEAAHPYITKLL